MNASDRDLLGLPPMQLAENTATMTPAQRVSTSNTLLRRVIALLSSKMCRLFAVFCVLAILLVVLLNLAHRNVNTGEANKADIVLVTGSRQPINDTQAQDMSVYIQIKDTSNETESVISRRRRNSGKRKPRQDRSHSGLKKFDVKKAREVIMNHSDTCDPENRNEFCKNILRKLNVSVIDEIEDPKTEVRQFRVANLDGADKKTTANLHHEQDNMHGMLPATVSDHGLFHNDRSSHMSSESSNIESFKRQYFYEPVPYGNTQPGEHGDCLAKRLMNQQYNFGPPGPWNYYGMPNQPYPFPNIPYNRPMLPYTAAGFINPPFHSAPYGSYQDNLPASRETAPSALDQSVHPQDVGIAMKYKDSLSFRSDLHYLSSSRSAFCSADMRACASEDVCLDKKRWCDRSVDCVDASDELSCSCKSKVDQARHCDGYYDCPFGEDEMGCFGCDEHAFSCDDVDLSAQSTCFTKEQRCDGVIDCPNRKDETECNILAPSLHDKPAFGSSHTEGFLHRNFKGKWYPVCENPYMWAHDICRLETGLILRAPLIQLTRIDPSFKGHFINNVHGDFSRLVDHCFNSSAVYVVCQDLLCGTRVMTETQMFRVDSTKENHLYGSLKRSTYSELSMAPIKGSIEAQSPEHNDGYLSKSIVKYGANENNTEGANAPESRKFKVIRSKSETRSRNMNQKVPSLDSRGKRAETRVVGGTPSQPGAWPWMVAILRNGMFHCGGVIVSNRWIVSAAHCVAQYWDHYFEIEVGMVRRFSYSPQERTHKVSHIIISDNYNRGKMVNDLTLMRVKPAIQYSRWIRPICLPDPSSAGPNWAWEPAPGTKCITVGWGAISEHGPDPDHMREVEVPVWESCKHRNDIMGNEICAGLVEGGKDACQGDSGGPLLCKNPLNSRQWYVAGIVSHGDGCARKGEPGAYTRVSLFTEWIYFHIGTNSLPTVQPKQECPGFQCISGIFKCLPKERKCDKRIDCLDGEDEINCNFVRNSFDDEDDMLLARNTIKFQNETQVQSTKTGETTQINDNRNQSKMGLTTPKFNENNPWDRTTETTLFEEILKRTQTQHGYDFYKDTEDLIKGHIRTTTETVKTNYETKFTTSRGNIHDKLVDITTAASFIDDMDDIEDHVKKFKYNVQAAMGENKHYNKIYKFQNSASHSPNKNFNSKEKQMSTSSSVDSESVTLDPVMSSSNEIESVFTNRFDQNTINEPKEIHSHDVIAVSKQNVSLRSNETLVGLRNQSISFGKTINISNFTSTNGSLMGINETIFNINNGTKKESEHFVENSTLPNEQHNVNVNNNNETNDNVEIISPSVNGENMSKHLHFVENSTLPNEQHTVNVNNNNQTNDNDETVSPSINEENMSKHLPPSTTEKSFPVTQNSEGKGLSTEISAHAGTFTTILPESSTRFDHEQGKIFPLQNNLLNVAHIKRKILRPNIFECLKISQIILSSLRCNHRADCEDGTDELGCTCVDYLTTFNPTMLCDGFVDCPDGSDELECYTCVPDQFLCKWSKMCLPYQYVCDGKSHCPDGEDELDCFTLSNGEFMTFDIDGRPTVNLKGFITKRYHKTWNIACEDDLDFDRQDQAATDICLYLGFSGYSEFKVKHINVPAESKERTFYAKSRSDRSIQRQRIQIIHQSTREKSDGKVLEDPIILPTHCVPNVSKTCATLYVTCSPTLTSDLSSHKLIPTQSESGSKAAKTSNEIIKHTTEYVWPWAAKVFVEGDYRCTGVLVDLSWVLISSSCLWDTLLSKDFVCAVLGGKRNLATSNSPFEQTIEVDAKKEIYDSQVTLLHLKDAAKLSRMVKPMVLPNINMHRSDSESCVTVGQGVHNHTVTILLNEIEADCGRKNKCFVKHNPGPPCQLKNYLGRPWTGIISCKGADGGGWYPAATYVETKGECGFQGNVAAVSLAHIRTDIKETILTSPKDLHFPEHESPDCAGVRCEHGACIPLTRVCDKVHDCDDGRDELADACEKKNKFCSLDPHDHECACTSGELKCRNGLCVAKQLFGNGQDDCGDGSDEPPRATCAMYLARAAPNRLCDGHLHCFDRSDEDPNFCKCFSTKTEQCHKSDTCVALDLVCDGVADCPHGDDEMTCMALTTEPGVPSGTGWVLERQFGVWHTKCYHKKNHTRSELEKICRDLGYVGGHALLLEPATPSMNPLTNIVVDDFTRVVLNDQTSISLRNSDRPLARAVADEMDGKCFPVYIECV